LSQTFLLINNILILDDMIIKSDICFRITYNLEE
jgi:hypothetical protein